MSALARSGRHPADPAATLICEGVQRFALGDYSGAATLLERARPELPRIGGSHAQRVGVLETLIVSALRSDQPELAEKVLAERLGLRAIWAGATAR